mmetsp:Transcript_30998/g.60472  ORF Transcript_30998/g.60472 Transcript_30998/m.60472 type:complete len:1199 (+) Transcript_30998:99-3695(+)|eukprot:CAMPEP_0175126984 /NCGR_PEP_ID=MMETSP0087-20121206/4151_1 /TAXON_ID=136419 /ORGANISM="Unknown Unknown, Strain D1" /LENGTH=1198 /DNA_ID=CAMNT_0016408945 /DNA_START=89 /DNA_END=3685 /DNA_ORIENTATION=-
MADATVGSLFIVVRESPDTAVEVPVQALPDTYDDVTDLLKSEVAPLQLWLEFAVAYYKQGKLTQFEEILKECTDETALQHYTEKEHQSAKIDIFTALGAFYLQRGLEEKHPELREQFFAQSADRFEKVQEITDLSTMLWVGKGLLSLAQKNVKKAQQDFEFALSVDLENICAMLGKAACQYHLKAYKDALANYKRALTLCPDLPASVRLGIGMCYLAMGDNEYAAKAFQRVLDLDDQNVDALLAKAIMELNSDHDNKFENSLKLCERAYDVNSNHPGVLCLLSDHYFFRRDFETTRKLASRGLNYAEDLGLKGECYFQIARSYHVEQDYAQAFQFYETAVQSDPHNTLAQFGYGQMCIRRKDNIKAVKIFENLLAAFPDNFDVLRLLGSLYDNPAVTVDREKRLKGPKLLQKAVMQAKTHVNLLIEVAQSTEVHSPEQAYEAYKSLIALLLEEVGAVPASLWNNLGVMCTKLDKLDEAHSCFAKARGVGGGNNAEGDQGSSEIKADSVTTVYNMGLLAEKRADLATASELYDSIMRSFPAYVDAYLRRAAMAHDKGDVKGAQSWVGKALEKQGEATGKAAKELKSACWSMQGWLHLQRNELVESHRKFSNILKSVNSGDSYSKLMLAHIGCQRAALAHRTRKPGDKPVDGASYTEAAKLYKSVLDKDSSNMYAANGLGAVLAAWGCDHEAKEAFLAAKEGQATGEFLVNLGHTYTRLGQHSSAITSYQHALDKHFPNDPNVMMYLARAHYVSRNPQQAKKVLIRAVHQSPLNELLWYNLALAQEDYAVRVLETTRAKRLFSEVKLSVSELEHAARVFARLAKRATNKKIKDKSSKHQKFCDDALEKAQLHLNDAASREQEYQKLYEQSAQAAADSKARSEQMKADKLAAEQAEKERLEEEAKRRQQLREELTKAWAQEREAEEAGKRAAIAAKEEEAAAGEGEKKKKAKRKKKSAAADEDEVEAEPAPEEDDEDDATAGGAQEDGLDAPGFAADFRPWEQDQKKKAAAARKSAEDENDKKDKKKKKDKKEKKKKKKEKKKEKRRRIERREVEEDEGEDDGAGEGDADEGTVQAESKDNEDQEGAGADLSDNKEVNEPQDNGENEENDEPAVKSKKKKRKAIVDSDEEDDEEGVSQEEEQPSKKRKAIEESEEEDNDGTLTEEQQRPQSPAPEPVQTSSQEPEDATQTGEDFSELEGNA